jgi:O-methyltransferase
MSSRGPLQALLAPWRARSSLDAAMQRGGPAIPAPAVPDVEFSFCCRQAIRLLRRRGAEWPIGDYLQFGIGCGTSIASVYHALEAEGLWHLRLFGFEPIEDGMEGAYSVHKPEAFRALLESKDRYLRRAEINWARITLIKGAFSQILSPELREQLRVGGASMILIDCERYETTLQALRFSESLIRDQTILFLDGYEAAEGVGQRLAFGEFMAQRPYFSVLQLPSYAARARVVLMTRKSDCDAARLAMDLCEGNAG